jgi:hypothetical protein
MVEEILFLRNEIDKFAKEKVALRELLTAEAVCEHIPPEGKLQEWREAWAVLDAQGGDSLAKFMKLVMNDSYNEGLKRALLMVNTGE